MRALGHEMLRRLQLIEVGMMWAKTTDLRGACRQLTVRGLCAGYGQAVIAGRHTFAVWDWPDKPGSATG